MWRIAAAVIALATRSEAAPRSAPTNLFPQRFSVKTGSTIPLDAGWGSITQAGSIYYDGENQWLRMEHESQGKQVSFIARFGEQRLYLMTGTNCVNVTVNGALMPFAAPKGSVLSEERAIVRDTYVSRYSGVVRDMEGKLHGLDFYAKQENRSSQPHTSTQTTTNDWIPWRTTYGRLYRREIGPGSSERVDPDDNRDWRYYKESEQNKDDDDTEVSPYVEPADQVTTIEDSSLKVTIDYYNFVAQPPKSSLFDPPEHCKKGDRSEGDFKFSFSGFEGGSFGHQIFEFQKSLADISANFQDAPGRQRLLEDACIRYFCDAAEKETNHDAKPVLEDDTPKPQEDENSQN
eukprot:TRINITY_DN9762_c1_g1_i1.p1 TRINITY_DN9762_c1_g1~~TRINITY_DN9762_c1_g1_i1.p1  ORF type:complete len:347 (+),score=62.16 TRINITY_DN9762_c1_g1_i1:53-1093(+)